MSDRDPPGRPLYPQQVTVRVTGPGDELAVEVLGLQAGPAGTAAVELPDGTVWEVDHADPDQLVLLDTTTDGPLGAAIGSRRADEVAGMAGGSSSAAPSGRAKVLEPLDGATPEQDRTPRRTSRDRRVRAADEERMRAGRVVLAVDLGGDAELTDVERLLALVEASVACRALGPAASDLVAPARAGLHQAIARLAARITVDDVSTTLAGLPGPPSRDLLLLDRIVTLLRHGSDGDDDVAVALRWVRRIVEAWREGRTDSTDPTRPAPGAGWTWSRSAGLGARPGPAGRGAGAPPSSLVPADRPAQTGPPRDPSEAPEHGDGGDHPLVAAAAAPALAAQAGSAARADGSAGRPRRRRVQPGLLRLEWAGDGVVDAVLDGGDHVPWVRVVRRRGLVMVGAAPLVREGGGPDEDAIWVAQVAVPPDIADEDLEADLVAADAVTAPGPLEALRDAVRIGRDAARAERLGRAHRAATLWEECARCWADVGDEAHVALAMARVASPQVRRTEPLVVDRVVAAR